MFQFFAVFSRTEIELYGAQIEVSHYLIFQDFEKRNTELFGNIHLKAYRHISAKIAQFFFLARLIFLLQIVPLGHRYCLTKFLQKNNDLFASYASKSTHQIDYYYIKLAHYTRCSSRLLLFS